MSQGHFFATVPCYVCGNLFGFDPEKVVCINGHPICEKCADVLNEVRAEKGKAPITIYREAYH